MPILTPTDFEIRANNSVTLQISIVDANFVPVTPISGAVGRFAISTAPGATAIVQRDSTDNPSEVWFTVAAPLWYLQANILATDTAALTPGSYWYEVRLDASGSQNSIRGGYFTLKGSSITA